MAQKLGDNTNHSRNNTLKPSHEKRRVQLYLCATKQFLIDEDGRYGNYPEKQYVEI